MNAQLKPLSEALETRIRERTSLELAAKVASAHQVAFTAYREALRRDYGHRFDLVIETALHDAEVAIAAAIRPFAEDEAFSAAVERLANESV